MFKRLIVASAILALSGPVMAYDAGDFIVREAGDVHAPAALPGGDCICLAVLEAPLRFTHWHHRWLSPLLQLRAG